MNVTLCVLAAASALSLPAWAFEQALSSPDVVVSVPRLPQVALGQPLGAGTGADRSWQGAGAGVDVDIHARPAASAGSTRLCAGSFLRELVRRPGMPERDSIYRAPIDADTFLVLYIHGEGPDRRLHGHLLAAAGDSHCVEAHFSRPLRPGEDVDDWRTSFDGAAVRPVVRR